MNQNQIITDTWSNSDTQRLYEERDGWPPDAAPGGQCGACSFFAPFNDDWGLCCHHSSLHLMETVFEHFACAVYEDECWGPHSFTTNKDNQCRCHGDSSETWERIIAAFYNINSQSNAAPAEAE